MAVSDASEFGASLRTLPPPPKPTAVRNAASRLAGFYDLPFETAFALARAIVDPGEFRRRLEHPLQHRVVGGVVSTVDTLVYVPAVSINPLNPRDAALRLQRRYGKDFAPLTSARAAESGAAELCLEVDDEAHLLWSVERSGEELAKHSYEREIAFNGVLQPVLVAAMRFRHVKDQLDIVLPVTLDGSTRLRSAQSILGLTPQQVMYELPGNDRSVRGLLGSVTAAQDRTRDELTPTERERHRALVMPARIVVRWQPDADDGLDFEEGMRGLVGLIHVDHPRPWTKEAQAISRTEGVVRQLQEDGLGDDTVAWFTGAITSQEARTRKVHPRADDETRHARIIGVILGQEWRPTVLRGFRRGSNTTNPGSTGYPTVAAELALRSYRTELDDETARGVRDALVRSLTFRYFRGGVDLTSQSPAELTDAALRELKAGEPGAAFRELLARSHYWLIKSRILRRDNRESPDSRALTEVLEAMVNPLGVRHLAEVLKAGREGRPAYVVDERGRRRKVDGKETLLDDWWLRVTFSGTRKAGDLPVERPRRLTADERYEALRDRFRAALMDAAEALEELTAVESAGGKLWYERGLPAGLVEECFDRVEKVTEGLYEQRSLARRGFKR